MQIGARWALDFGADAFKGVPLTKVETLAATTDMFVACVCVCVSGRVLGLVVVLDNTRVCVGWKR